MFPSSGTFLRHAFHQFAGLGDDEFLDALAPAAGVALRRHGLAAMTAMRIVPAAPFAVEGILAGAMRVKIWHFTVGTILGTLPGVLATSVFGHQLTAALEDPSKINWWIVAAVVVAFAALIWYFKRQLTATKG